jgi:diguanylate cyclase (GGDEF)-like protein
LLPNVKLVGNINQLPVTELEKERFAYFYRDQITDAYNSKYLNNILNQNVIKKEFICVNTIYMHNFSTYNEKYGWAKGDLFLKKFAGLLIEKFPLSFIFRIHGDDFVIIGKSHTDIVLDDLMQQEMFKESNITLSYKHVDLRQNNINNLHELEIAILKHN